MVEDSVVDRPGLSSSTLAHHIYRELESRIVDGAWLPDTRISLRKLATLLNTSMQPVREAVSKLVADSALEVIPGRAVRVPQLSREQADEIWTIRMLLEGEAAAQFAARKCPEEARPLYGHTDTMRVHYPEQDHLATMKAIRGWNIALVHGSKSPVLIDMVMRLRLRYAPFIASCLAVDQPHDPDFVSFTLHIQDELVMAIEAGDAAAARHLRCSDLRSFQRYLYSRRGWR
ncbi:GntR family transcriptional regulator [Ancylobacter sp. Lp-2]|uniref:GntR family transcriptional regulator n=1 Tax=Ancylobacter sp. Lp-2 TaxID=2881339 RepID=UPI001E2A7100|nr:GntR family transcriptional regulator [Ancylobacter sp. Lp-2]MCB4768149.1 GntR family transcriptional regulator [Ancylobacter sp. Lp-2]